MVHSLRGKCKEKSEKLVAENSNLKLVRGWYHCYGWGTVEQHWWCKDKITGEIVDPTKDQFPCRGTGDYEEYKGILSCAECGKELPEEEMQLAGRYPVCSGECYGRLVGVY